MSETTGVDAKSRVARFLQVLALMIASAVAGALVLGFAGAANAANSNCTSGTVAENGLCVAKKQVGDPYVWGANGPNSFDCSGLVYYSMKKAGVKWGDMTAAGQLSYGNSKDWDVSKNNLKAGDLLYFDWTGDGKADHTGIYAGNGKMVDAPGKGRNVRTVKLSSDHKNHMVGAVRPGGKDSKPVKKPAKKTDAKKDTKGEKKTDAKKTDAKKDTKGEKKTDSKEKTPEKKEEDQPMVLIPAESVGPSG